MLLATCITGAIISDGQNNNYSGRISTNGVGRKDTLRVKLDYFNSLLIRYQKWGTVEKQQSVSFNTRITYYSFSMRDKHLLNKEDKLLFLCLLSPGFYICKSIFEKDHNSLTHICQAVALLGPHFTMQSTMHIDLQGTVQDLPFWKVSRCSKLKGCILLYHVCYRIHYGKKNLPFFLIFHAGWPLFVVV